MKHVLLVEPNENVAGIIKDFLEQSGDLKVYIANNAQEGIHQADKQKPDIVVLELAMPMHNGFAFLHEFRSYGDWSNIPVIVHSHLAKDEASMSKSWKILGAVEYFYKPKTSLLQLKNSVRAVLEI